MVQLSLVYFVGGVSVEDITCFDYNEVVMIADCIAVSKIQLKVIGFSASDWMCRKRMILL